MAATRAGSSLTLSRAHFYLSNKKPKKPGRFWNLLAESAAKIHFSAEPEVPESNPNLGDGEWREEAETDDFPLRAAEGDGEQAAASLGVSGWEDELERLRLEARRIPQNPRPAHVLPAPETHSPSSLMEFETCPRRYYYAHVFPVPDLDGGLDESRERGSSIHAYIEGGLRGDPPEAASAKADAKAAGAKADPRRSWHAFRQSEYGKRAANYPLYEGEPPATGPARLVEAPFSLEVGQAEIRGRMDAIFVDEDGTFHLVDWKSGTPREEYAERLQLPLYALAAHRLWGVEEHRIRLAYAFAPGDETVEVDTPEGFLALAETRALAAIERIRRRDFEPRPSHYACSHCPVIGLGLRGCPKEVPEK